MGKIILYILMPSTSIVALFQPWIGVLAAYVFAIMGPQFIWFWNFSSVRPFLFISVPTIIGCGISILHGKATITFIKTKINLFILIWWLCLIMSYFFGPFVNMEYHLFDPHRLIGRMSNMFLFYYIAVLCIDNHQKFKYSCYALAVSVIVLIWWANDQYFSGQFFGRLGGPMTPTGGSMYLDENVFGMVFVMGLPFLYYLGLYANKLIVRFAFWALIPLGWHAVFLTASRGALLGVAVTLFITVIRSRRKLIGLAIIPALILFYQWQGGSTMKDRADTINEYEEDRSAMTRLEAWEAAASMIVAHPIVGVGLASFMTAFPYYSEYVPRVAHNSYLQLTAESGLLAGASYIIVLTIPFVVLWRRKQPLSTEDRDEYFLSLMSDAIIASLAGFAVCAFFLSIETLELFFYLCMISNYLVVFRSGKQKSLEAPSGRQDAVPQLLEDRKGYSC